MSSSCSCAVSSSTIRDEPLSRMPRDHRLPGILEGRNLGSLCLSLTVRLGDVGVVVIRFPIGSYTERAVWAVSPACTQYAKCVSACGYSGPCLAHLRASPLDGGKPEKHSRYRES